MKTPQIINKNKPIDIELCDLMGEKQRDFLVLCFDGIPLEFFGTPYDTPGNRIIKENQVESLNSQGSDSRWPEFFNNWKVEICSQFGLFDSTTSEDYQPEISYAISRVCAGYSEYPHAAIQLLEKIQPGTKWEISWSEKGTRCSIEAANKIHTAIGEPEEIAEAIALAVLSFLRDNRRPLL